MEINTLNCAWIRESSSKRSPFWKCLFWEKDQGPVLLRRAGGQGSAGTWEYSLFTLSRSFKSQFKIFNPGPEIISVFCLFVFKGREKCTYKIWSQWRPCKITPYLLLETTLALLPSPTHMLYGLDTPGPLGGMNCQCLALPFFFSDKHHHQKLPREGRGFVFL